MRMKSLAGLLTATAVAITLPSIAAAQEVEAEVVALPEWGYDELYADGISVEELLEADVNGPTGDEIGDIENVLFSEDGEIISVIAEVGGFLEIGDTHVNIPWDEVEVGAGADEIVIPVTQETIEEYSLFPDEVVTAPEAATDIEAVEGDNLGTVDTGPRVWRAAEIIGDYARLRDGDGFANYGYVDDLIVRDGMLEAVVVSPDVGWGAVGGAYAYPFYGYGYGWTPGAEYYDLPYGREEIGALEPFDYERLGE